jgi:NAD(P)H-dependent FMN reductase
MPRLLIVIASTRPGRRGAAVADWFAAVARKHGGFDVEIADLAEVDLPLLNEPNDDARDDYVHEHTKRWSATVASADAVVFVMPEYNRTFTAPLKNALDYLYYEWNYKPVGLVSYGGVSGGLRAAYAIKPALTALRMVPIDDGVTISRVRRRIVDGQLQADEMHTESAAEMLDELAKLSAALAPLRPDLMTSASGGS